MTLSGESISDVNEQVEEQVEFLEAGGFIFIPFKQTCSLPDNLL